MAILAAAAPSRSPMPRPVNGSYEPGICNIGPAEIARRRRTGHIGMIATIVLLAVLVVVHATTPLRLLAFFPAAVAAAGYLQSWLRFCAGFGWLGVLNFDEVGTTERVGSSEDRARDRAMAIRIGLASAAIGVAVAIAAFVLPA
jgi:hypothetical protein